MNNSPLSLKEIAFKTEASSINAITFDDDLSIENADDVIVFLHGWLDNSSSFIPVFEHLRTNDNKKFKIIAIDLPGHGKSPHKSTDSHYYFIDWVHDLLALFECNNWANVHLVGHSMGGMIASSFSAIFPEKVKSLTLIDSIGVLTSEEKKTTALLRKGLLSRLKKPSVSKNKLSVDRATKARMHVSDLSYKHAEMIVARNIATIGGKCEWRSDRKLTLASPYKFSLAQCKQLISDIEAPVLVIYGSKGLDFIRKGIDIYTPLMQCKKIVEVEGGHHVHMEKPDETAKLINEFVLSI